MTSTAESPDKYRDPDGFKLLLLEANTLGVAQSWRCTNGNGVLVSNEHFLTSPNFPEYFGLQLLEFLSTYLAQASFESW
jgi:hypothetical protein